MLACVGPSQVCREGLYHYLSGMRCVGQLDGDLEDVCAALSVLVGGVVGMLVAVGVGGRVAIGGLCSYWVVSHGSWCRHCCLGLCEYVVCRGGHSPDLLEASLLVLAAILAVSGGCDYSKGTAQRERQGRAVAKRRVCQRGALMYNGVEVDVGVNWGLGRHSRNIFSDPKPHLAASFMCTRLCGGGLGNEPAAARKERNARNSGSGRAYHVVMCVVVSIGR